MQCGFLNGPAHELRVGTWIDGNGDPWKSHFNWLTSAMDIRSFIAFNIGAPGVIRAVFRRSNTFTII